MAATRPTKRLIRSFDIAVCNTDLTELAVETPEFEAVGFDREATAQPVLFRCPACRKLYSADASDLRPSPRPNSHSTDAVFECVECRSEFSIGSDAATADCPPLARLASEATLSPATRERVRATEQEILKQPGAKAPTPAIAAQLRGAQCPCPRCFKMNSAQSEDCASCGVIFRKWRPMQDFETEVRAGGTRELGKHWDDVVAAWENERTHQVFIDACGRDRRLSFAALKYRRVLDANPGDSLAQSMIRRADALAATTPPPSGALARALAFDLALLPRVLTSAVIFLAAALLIVGIFAPGFGNLAGLGASFLALAVGLRVWLGNSR